MAVYVVEAVGLDRVKIGYCGPVDPTARLSNMQVGSAVPLVLRRLFTYLGRKGERDLHVRFRRHRLHGEWFRYAAEIRAWAEAPEREHETQCQRDADRRARVEALSLVPLDTLRSRLAVEIRSGGTGSEAGELFDAMKPRMSRGERQAWYGGARYTHERYPEETRLVEAWLVL